MFGYLYLPASATNRVPWVAKDASSVNHQRFIVRLLRTSFIDGTYAFHVGGHRVTPSVLAMASFVVIHKAFSSDEPEQRNDEPLQSSIRRL